MKILVHVIILCYLSSSIHLYPVQNEEKNESEGYQQIDNDKMMNYLHKYGYLESMDNISHEKMKAALMDFQQFSGVPPTGEMNQNTSIMMGHPRCGMPDKQSSRRFKRYGFFARRIWETHRITYKIHNYTPDMDKESVDNEIERAVNEWSQLTNIHIKPYNHHHHLHHHHYDHAIDVHIYFDSIDGGGDVLGFAYSPTNGTIVFDEDESWTKKSRRGINLFQIAVHELGHSLGLGHSDDRSSVMYPLYLGYVKDFKLDLDDIRGITALYKVNPYQEYSSSGDNTLLCRDPKIDAIFSSPDYFIYVLKEDKYWKFNINFDLVEGPCLIKERWPEVPNNVDAAFTYWNNVTYFLKGPYMWKYIQDQKYKKSQLIAYGFPGIPDDVDATLTWTGDGKIYFFKGRQYWMLNPRQPVAVRVNETYPLSITRWNGLPNNLDAAVGIGGLSYFFKDGKYYVYDDLRMRVQQGYPRHSTQLFRCI